MIAQDKVQAQVQGTSTCAKCPYFDAYQGRHGWCGVFSQAAKPHHKGTEICSQEVLRLQSKAQRLAGKTGDSVSHQQKPTHVDEAEYEQGRCHGQRDAGDRLPPMYLAPSDQYAAGYLEGYNSYINPSPQPKEAIEAPRWSVKYDPKWDWYRVWVGDRCVRHASTYDEAERLAQRYIVADETIQRQNRAIMTAHGD